MHNMPGLPVGKFATRPGPLMAATDEFTIDITGHGGHAARPHGTIDPIIVGIGDRPGAADDRLALGRSDRSGGGLGDQVPCRRRLQRHRRNGASSPARCARSSPRCATWSKAACAASSASIAAAFGATVDLRLRAQLPGNPQPPAETALRPKSRARSSAPRRSTADGATGDGRRGFLLHAGGAARRLHFRRQRRHAPACTTRPTISTTRSSRSAARIGRGWSRRPCRRNLPRPGEQSQSRLGAGRLGYKRRHGCAEWAAPPDAFRLKLPACTRRTAPIRRDPAGCSARHWAPLSARLRHRDLLHAPRRRLDGGDRLDHEGRGQPGLHRAPSRRAGCLSPPPIVVDLGRPRHRRLRLDRALAGSATASSPARRSGCTTISWRSASTSTTAPFERPRHAHVVQCQRGPPGAEHRDHQLRPRPPDR